MAKLDLKGTFKDIEFDRPEKMLGKGAMQPNNPSNSGSRKLMLGTHLEQRLTLCNPDVPYIQTGYEKEFGLYSSSYMETENEYEVIAVIPKFIDNPRYQYYVICIDHEHKTLTVFEKKQYKHITESYGYIYSSNSAINYVEPGDIIPKGTALMKSTAFDEYNNRMDGKNLLTMYTACEETMEDAIVISEDAAKALSSPLIKKVTIQINDNEIPLNLYGKDEEYKIFPDIGEEIEHGILCGLRVEKKEESLYSLSYNRLRELMISDERYTVSGVVSDIDVYCNAPDRFIDNPYYGQIHKYYQSQMTMFKMIVDSIDNVSGLFHEGYKMDYNLQKLYSDAKGALNGKQYYTNGKAFSNIVIEITVIDRIPILRGDKLTNRYGGKGVTARIRPNELMPQTPDGKHIDVLLNICGVIGRMNAGQLFELSVSHICIKIVEHLRENCSNVGECLDCYLRLLKIVSPSQYNYMDVFLDNLSDDERILYLQTLLDDNCIYISVEPISENMTIQKLEELYDEFPWIWMDNLKMPLIDSNGEIRYVESRRPIVYGYLYFYRLKQYAEEKFSVTSLSSTNIKNENTRNKASNNYKALYSRTPIRFGEMEFGNFNHMGADLVSQILMIYSSSPLARQLCYQLQTGDPFNIDVKLDMDSKNRNAEILNVYLKTKGLKLTFSKHLKKRKFPALISPMVFWDKPAQDPMVFYAKGEKIDVDGIVEEMIEKRNNEVKNPMEFFPMEFFDEVNLDEDGVE